MKIYYLLVAAFAVLTISCQQENENQQFKPGQIWADNNGIHINAHGGGILYYNNTYFWYGEHKIEGKKGNSAQVGVHVYSSKDLYNWTDKGIALKVVEDDPNHDITQSCILERPKVIYNKKTNKFVMWFHLELKGMGYKAARTGVAIADEPTGPFKFIESLNPNAGQWPENFTQEDISRQFSDTLKEWSPEWKQAVKDGLFLHRDFEKGQMARDMTLFVDDDGKAYHIHASEENQTLHISQLNDDYTGFSGKYVSILPSRSNEAPAIFKKDGIYYLVASDCTGWAPNAARSAWATNIFGPWTEVENPCVGNGADKTFESQSTYILPVQGKKDAYIFMADRWMPENAIDGRYIWLPIKIEGKQLKIEWMDEWNLSVFDK